MKREETELRIPGAELDSRMPLTRVAGIEREGQEAGAGKREMEGCHASIFFFFFDPELGERDFEQTHTQQVRG